MTTTHVIRVAAMVALVTAPRPGATHPAPVTVTSEVDITAPGDRFAEPLGVPLMLATVEQVEQLLGPSRAADDDSFICYIAPERQVFFRFLLEPRFPSPTGLSRVVAFNMRELAGATAARCLVLSPAAERRLDLVVGGLGLGMPRDEVAAVLEPEHFTPDGGLYRHFRGERSISPEGYGRDLVVKAQLRDDKLTELDINASWGRLDGRGAERAPSVVAETLGLSADQRARLDALNDRQNQRLKPLLDAARHAREAFRKALETEGADATSVGQAALAMQAADNKVRADHQVAIDEMKAILTPDQREKAEEIYRLRQRGRRDPTGSATTPAWR
jgi:Spy/CpxP family protein refolding chaperone